MSPVHIRHQFVTTLVEEEGTLSHVTSFVGGHKMVKDSLVVDVVAQIVRVTTSGFRSFPAFLDRLVKVVQDHQNNLVIKGVSQTLDRLP